MAKPTLRGRLTFWYTIALLVALSAFATLALVTIDSVQRHLLEGELVAVAREEAATMGYDANSETITASGATRFGAVAGSRVASALLADDGRPLVASAARVPEVISRMASSVETESAVTLHDRGDTLRTVFVPLPTSESRHATIAAWSDIGPIERVDRKIGLIFAIAIPFVTALATFFGSLIARRGLAPLGRIIAAASEIEANDLAVRIAQPDTHELDRLATTLNRMLERLDAGFERERRFTNDASHEFRAPLSIILAEADLALSVERPAAQYKRALETIAIEAEAMERLTRDLLSTARRRNDDANETAPVDLGEIAEAAGSRLRILAERRGIVMDTDVGAESGIAAHADAIEQAVVTVVHNAIKYATSRCIVSVRRDSATSVEVRVSDDGPGFSASALEHAFDRFWRESGSDRNNGGHGLGLPIARSIVERFHGSIAIANSSAGGAIVSMRFPALNISGR